MPISKNTVGIDLGLNDLFVTSDGQKSGNPRHTKRYERKLAHLQRKLAKKQKGSNNRAKTKLKVARLHAKIADCRMDATHKASRKLINENQVVCVESLSMIKNPKLAKHIADANWGEFVRQLQYKAEWAGKTVVQIDRFFPSTKRCPDCGFVHERLPLSVREWDCPQCRAHWDRDIAAAINTKTATLAELACGATGTGMAAQATIQGRRVEAGRFLERFKNPRLYALGYDRAGSVRRLWRIPSPIDTRLFFSSSTATAIPLI